MTGFNAVYLKARHGYVGFVEELPLCTAQGRTIDETRRRLRELLVVVFDAERQRTRELIADRELVREKLDVAPPLG